MYCCFRAAYAQALLLSLPLLQDVDVSGCKAFGDNQLTACCQCLPHLNSLDLRGTSVGRRGQIFLTQITGLTRLAVDQLLLCSSEVPRLNVLESEVGADQGEAAGDAGGDEVVEAAGVEEEGCQCQRSCEEADEPQGSDGEAVTAALLAGLQVRNRHSCSGLRSRHYTMLHRRMRQALITCLGMHHAWLYLNVVGGGTKG